MDSASAHGDYEVSTDKSRLDIDVIHGFLATAYWSPGIARRLVERAIEHSLCFGVYGGGAQVGFARVVTDYSSFAYLADVFILEAHRGKGLSKKLVASIVEHPELKGLRRFLLFTRDAHGLYGRFGFKPTAEPGRIMEILRPAVPATRS